MIAITCENNCLWCLQANDMKIEVVSFRLSRFKKRKVVIFEEY